ncbi:MAG: peptide chain release factor 1 [Candidatus Schekmanbacteria bacterium]|nr:peptide chain release factor 1 [Candidatus Schekmanbacteria bacterium]
MFDRLDKTEERYEELGNLLSDPSVHQDRNAFTQYSKERAALSKIVDVYREYKKIKKQLDDNKELLRTENDEELRNMAKDEISILEQSVNEITERLKILLLPKDSNDEKNILLEIRAGAGGDEAALFVANLFRMYTMFAEKKKWKVEILTSNPTGIGGFKEIIALIEGEKVYSFLKFESGVHRVQRIPLTEAGGRIHTSTVTVAVLPEAEDVEINIDPTELKIDVYRSSGPGGQSVNTTDSAVRVTHIPTNTVVCCQDEKSQHKNKAKALKILRARLLERMQQEQQDEIAKTRKSQVGTGDRSERIRTYNYPQGRVTDHRIGLTLHKLNAVLDGEIDEIVNALISSYQTELLQQTAV